MMSVINVNSIKKACIPVTAQLKNHFFLQKLKVLTVKCEDEKWNGNGTNTNNK